MTELGVFEKSCSKNNTIAAFINSGSTHTRTMVYPIVLFVLKNKKRTSFLARYPFDIDRYSFQTGSSTHLTFRLDRGAQHLFHYSKIDLLRLRITDGTLSERDAWHI